MVKVSLRLVDGIAGMVLGMVPAEHCLRKAALIACVVCLMGAPAPCEVPGLINTDLDARSSGGPTPTSAPPDFAPSSLTPAGASDRVDAGLSSGRQSTIPHFNLEHFKRLSLNRVPAGSILSGVLEDTISSAKSKPGDVFSLCLEDGFFLNNSEVLPKRTRIIGSVVNAVSARSMCNGNPGQVNLSLQTIVLPDGRTSRFWGFINHNPGQDLKKKPGSEAPFASAPGYLKRGIFDVLHFGASRLTIPMQYHNTGPELEISKGTLLPISVGRELDLSGFSAPVAPCNAGSLVNTAPPDQVSAPGDGAVHPPNSGVSNPSVPGYVPDGGGQDPNAVFNAPIRRDTPRAPDLNPF